MFSRFLVAASLIASASGAAIITATAISYPGVVGVMPRAQEFQITLVTVLANDNVVKITPSAGMATVAGTCTAIVATKVAGGSSTECTQAITCAATTTVFTITLGTLTACTTGAVGNELIVKIYSQDAWAGAGSAAVTVGYQILAGTTAQDATASALTGYTCVAAVAATLPATTGPRGTGDELKTAHTATTFEVALTTSATGLLRQGSSVTLTFASGGLHAPFIKAGTPTIVVVTQGSAGSPADCAATGATDATGKILTITLTTVASPVIATDKCAIPASTAIKFSLVAAGLAPNDATGQAAAMLKTSTDTTDLIVTPANILYTGSTTPTKSPSKSPSTSPTTTPPTAAPTKSPTKPYSGALSQSPWSLLSLVAVPVLALWTQYY